MIIAASASLVSCSNDNDDHDYHLEYVSVKSADVPDEFDYGNTYEIEITIDLKNSCHFFYGQFDYFYDEDTRLIYPIVHIDDEVGCNPIITEKTFKIPIKITQKEPYILKFYQGEDEDGDDTFLTIEVPVNKDSFKNIETLNLKTDNTIYN